MRCRGLTSGLGDLRNSAGRGLNGGRLDWKLGKYGAVSVRTIMHHDNAM